MQHGWHRGRGRPVDVRRGPRVASPSRHTYLMIDGWERVMEALIKRKIRTLSGKTPADVLNRVLRSDGSDLRLNGRASR